jgi:hypothetical protein
MVGWCCSRHGMAAGVYTWGGTSSLKLSNRLPTLRCQMVALQSAGWPPLQLLGFEKGWWWWWWCGWGWGWGDGRRQCMICWCITKMNNHCLILPAVQPSSHNPWPIVARPCVPGTQTQVAVWLVQPGTVQSGKAPAEPAACMEDWSCVSRHTVCPATPSQLGSQAHSR